MAIDASNVHKKVGEDRTCRSRDTLADRDRSKDTRIRCSDHVNYAEVIKCLLETKVILKIWE